jgi:hypothetical protein
VKVLDKIDRELTLSPRHRAALRQRQAYFRAHRELVLGKQAFFRVDPATALEHMERANQFFKSARLRLVCALMRVSPGALLRLYRLRDRLVVGTDTSF